MRYNSEVMLSEHHECPGTRVYLDGAAGFSGETCCLSPLGPVKPSRGGPSLSPSPLNSESLAQCTEHRIVQLHSENICGAKFIFLPTSSGASNPVLGTRRLGQGKFGGDWVDFIQTAPLGLRSVFLLVRWFGCAPKSEMGGGKPIAKGFLEKLYPFRNTLSLLVQLSLTSNVQALTFRKSWVGA